MSVKYFAYLRVSTDAQDVKNQKTGVSEYCLKMGFAPVEWIEDTASGKIAWQERELGNVINTCREGDILIVSEVSRIARSTLGVLEVIEAARKKGLAVHIVKQNLIADGSTQSHITLTVLGLAAQIERDLIAARTKEALAQRKAEGVKLGRPKGKGKSKLDKHRATIFELLDKKVSKASVAKIVGCTYPNLHRWLVEYAPHYINKI